MFDIRSNKTKYSDTKKEFKITYQDEWSYVYEYYRPNKQGYTPTWDKISISKKENELTYERILDWNKKHCAQQHIKCMLKFGL
mgnify:CR=1 FL=1